MSDAKNNEREIDDVIVHAESASRENSESSSDSAETEVDKHRFRKRTRVSDRDISSAFAKNSTRVRDSSIVSDEDEVITFLRQHATRRDFENFKSKIIAETRLGGLQKTAELVLNALSKRIFDNFSEEELKRYLIVVAGLTQNRTLPSFSERVRGLEELFYLEISKGKL